MAEAEGFLNRWSRRKLAEKDKERSAEPAETVAVAEDAEEAAAIAAEGTEEAERERHPAEDIDIDSLTAESDFKIFLEAGVPAAVKRKALRKLWTTNPVLFGRDPLNDDFDIADTKKWGIEPPRVTSSKLARHAQEIKDEVKRGVEAADEQEAPDPADSAEPEQPAGAPEEGDEGDDAVAAADRDRDEEPTGDKG